MEAGLTFKRSHEVYELDFIDLYLMHTPLALQAGDEVIQRGTAPQTTSKTHPRVEVNFDVSAIPEDAVRETSEETKSRVRFNAAAETDVPGSIARGK